MYIFSTSSASANARGADNQFVNSDSDSPNSGIPTLTSAPSTTAPPTIEPETASTASDSRTGPPEPGDDLETKWKGYITLPDDPEARKIALSIAELLGGRGFRNGQIRTALLCQTPDRILANVQLYDAKMGLPLGHQDRPFGPGWLVKAIQDDYALDRETLRSSRRFSGGADSGPYTPPVTYVPGSTPVWSTASGQSGNAGPDSPTAEGSPESRTGQQQNRIDPMNKRPKDRSLADITELYGRRRRRLAAEAVGFQPGIQPQIGAAL